MDNKFSIRRAMDFVKFMFRENKKGIALAIASAFGAIIAIEILIAIFIKQNLYTGNNPGLEHEILVFNYMRVKSVETVIVLVITYCVSTYFPSRILGFLGNKGRASRYMMIPATMTEKFAALGTISLIIAPLLSFLTAFAATAVASLVETFIFNCSYFIGIDSTLQISEASVFTLSSIATTSLFFFGATFWHHHAFIKSLALNVSLGFAALALILSLAFAHTYFGWDFNCKITINNDLTLAIWSLILITIWSTLAWLAFKKRSYINK